MPSFISAGYPALSAADIAWIAILPTVAPALSTDERGRLTALRSKSTDPRITARIDAILAA